MELNIGMICGSIPALAPLFGFAKASGSKYPYPPSSSGGNGGGTHTRYHRFSKHGHDASILEHELSDTTSASVGLKDAGAGPGTGAIDEVRVTDAELGLTNPSAVGRAVSTNANRNRKGDTERGVVGAAADNGNSWNTTTSAGVSRKTSATIPRLTKPIDLTVPKERRGIGVTYEVQVQSEKMDEGWLAEEGAEAGRWDARSGEGRGERDWAGVPVIGATEGKEGRGEQRAFRWNVV